MNLRQWRLEKKMGWYSLKKKTDMMIQCETCKEYFYWYFILVYIKE